ncbi:MAG: MCE family protein, partial [Actinomycetota bacterium]
PVYSGGPELEDGAVLALEDTQIPAELDDVFRQLKKLLDAIEPGREGAPGALGKLIVQLNDTLADREQQLKGTLLYGAELTGTLADARDDLSNLLVNLDGLFTHLATRASSIGTLNVNMATVMATLAESRDDLEGTLGNLARMTGEVERVVREHGDRLGGDLKLAARITSAVLRNRASVEESLAWLPIMGEKLAAAYHGGRINSTDVRDHTFADKCHELEDLPGPVKDVLEDVFEAFCGSPPQQRQRAAEAPVEVPLPDVTEDLDCDEEVRKVKRQLRRIEELGVPDDVKEELLKPLKRKLRRLSKECEELADALEEGNLLDQILEDVGGIPELDEVLEDTTEDVGGLTGSAAGSTVAPPPAPGFWDRVGGWFSSLLGFVGGGS